jgi:predicted ATPase
MIKSIELKNFKSIKAKYFPLRNLNVLLGLNGQGKSSFIQSLLILRQSADSLKRGVLQLNGNEFSIGTTKDALYQYSGKNESLSIALAFDDKEPYLMNFDYTIGSDVFNQTNKETDIYGEGKDKLDSKQPLFANNFQYLNANRIEPQSIHKKSYTSVVTLNNIGSLGQYTVDYLETKGDEDIEFDNCIHHKTISSRNNQGVELKDKRLKNQVNLWMSEISPDVNIRTTSVSSDIVKLEYEFEQPTYGKTMVFKPENVGFGISYSLHVVVALLKAKSGDLLIIENPESHIHPKGQAQLGNLIALVAQNDVQVIIETHSDHILNGIRVAVKENPVLKDRTGFFYFEKLVTDLEQYSQITNIEVDKNGELSEYPANLLAEWSNQLLKLL